MLKIEEIEPGILMSSEVIVKDSSGCRGVKISDLFNGLPHYYRWLPMRNLRKKTLIVGQNSGFVEIESVYVRPPYPNEDLVELVLDFSRRVVVSGQYPCAITNQDVTLLGCVPACRVSTRHRIPTSRALRILLPHSYRSGLGRGIQSLLEEKKDRSLLKDHFAPEKLEGVYRTTAYETTPCTEEMEPDACLWTNGTDSAETLLVRFKLKHANMFMTSAGILLFA